MKAIKTRTTIVCMSLVVMGLSLIAQSYAQDVSDEAFLVAYLFDEGGGDTAKDLSANGRDGDIQGGAEYVDDGVFGKAIEVDGTGWIGVPEVGTFDEFTIVTWISGPAPVGAVNGGIFYVDGWSAGFLHYATWLGTVHFSVHSNDPQVVTDIPVEEEWLHLAAVYSAPEKLVAIYADGELDTETELTTAVPVIIGPGWIGSWVNQRFWTGMFDEFAIFDEVLEQDQIQNIMNNGLENRAAVSPADGSATTWGQIKYE